ncbi:hypothetical protein FB468_0590 [Leucobacter komagatae]|uniref:Uncharacterized protein n=1 Tax=Leucobacter komagatae TaxID=55969 RepID=A0A542Y3F3_9MICO|nr:hypothetical protein [Leucobacter komagatae]TQL42588.1 hypothetical protein FB468_0590 [Leucobacter komagatae]
MPTFQDPIHDADEASQALRGLAHATRSFDDPAATYAVIGDLLGGARSLRQVLDQLSRTHLTHQNRAFNDAGSHEAGAQAALAAADALHQAATLLDAVDTHLDAASQASGKIAWHPASTPEPAHRYVSVVFLQGEEAGRVLDLIGADGTDAAIDHLAGWDYGEETMQAALVNGYVYDTPPTGALDSTAERGEYVLTYNRDFGHVSLLRSFTPEPEPASAVSEAEAVGRDAHITARADAFANPFRSTVVAAVIRNRGLGL